MPDVLLSRVALDDIRRALRACGWALAGALVGGALMYGWAQRDLAAAERALETVPAISSAAIAEVGDDIAVRGAWAVFLGPLSGTPYKIYAVESAARGLSLSRFLAISVPARLLRFVLVSLLFAGAARWPLRGWTPARLRLAHAVAWIGFYAFYFAAKDW